MPCALPRPKTPAGLLAALGLLLLVTGAAGCAGRQETTGPDLRQPLPDQVEEMPARPPTAALLLPLTGQAAPVAQDMLDAAQMALFDVGATDLVLKPKDTKGTPEGAAAAARAALDEGVDLILGPLYAASTGAVGPVAAGANVRVLAFSNDAGVAGGGTWILGYRPEEQVMRVMGVAGRNGLSPVAAIAPDDAYGARALAAWRGAGGGGRSAVYPPGETDLARVVKGMVASDPPPALLVADGGDRLRSMSALFAYYGLDAARTRLLGTMLWLEDPTLLAEPALQGGWLASVPPDEDGAFARRFEDLYGRPPATLAGLAYDATALAAVLANDGRGFDGPQLAAPGGFSGHAGIFRLLPGGLTEHGLAVVEVQNGALGVVDPAPTGFAGPALLGEPGLGF
ncbi:MAG: penicillin-binding protein activator [Geminicoccaceae bacterium]|nr:penicillin-binding protein activator [Geminicoccaceae bacterium]